MKMKAERPANFARDILRGTAEEVPTVEEESSGGRMKGKYGRSEKGMFEAIDSIGVPHPYCVGPRHVGHAADHFGGRLGKEAIESGERCGIGCCTPECQLCFSEHEQALVIACYKELKDAEGKADPELHQYLLKIKEMAVENGYAGFVFWDKRKAA